MGMGTIPVGLVRALGDTGGCISRPYVFLRDLNTNGEGHALVIE